MNRYAVKFIRFPAKPAHSYDIPQMLPKGAAILVTKDIIAKMKNIVMIATQLRFCVAIVFLY